MTAVPLPARRVEKPWGRSDLSAPFVDPADGTAPIGEIIFDLLGGSDPELLVKFLFTSEKLSIQVHPDDESARAEGYPRGKDEAWIVLAAEPGATIGLGLTHEVSKRELRAAALNGSLETLVDWRPVAAGDCFYSAAGTIHAIGPGLSLVEIQQNLDLTYRLYDYGRPRELHLEQAVEAARTAPAPGAQASVAIGPGRVRLAGGPAFQVERMDEGIGGRLLAPERGLWLIPLGDGGEVDGRPLRHGEVWLLEGACDIRPGPGGAVIAYPGEETLALWEPS